jgi:hypothetical protein
MPVHDKRERPASQNRVAYTRQNEPPKKATKGQRTKDPYHYGHSTPSHTVIGMTTRAFALLSCT